MNPTETAVLDYIAAWEEPNADVRMRLLESCFAEDGRFLTTGAPANGRAALAARMAAFHSTPHGRRARLTSRIDVQGPLFRFAGVLEDADGKVIGESFDAGEIGPDGRITLLLTFVGHSLA